MTQTIPPTGCWTCKTCKGQFPTMADMATHTCTPKPFARPPAGGVRRKITKQAVDAMTANGTDQFLWDAGDGALKGFGVRMSPTGTASFLVQYRNAQGRSRRLVLGRVGVLTPDQARAAARDKLAEVAKGADPSEDRHATRSAMTWGELCDWYVKAARDGVIVGRKGVPIKASSIDADESRIRNHIKPTIGDKPIGWMTSDRATKLQADIAAGCTAKPRTSFTGRGGHTPPSGGRQAASRAVGMLEAVWWHGRRHLGPTVIPGSCPFEGVQLYAHTPNERYLTLAQYRAFGAAMRQAAADGATRTGLACIRALLLTGCRKMEILAMPKTTFDGASRCLRLADSKTGPQMRPLGKAAVEHLTAQLAIAEDHGGDYMFPGEFGAEHYSNIHRLMEQLCKSAGLEPGLTPHMFRHSFASMAAALGYSELVIKGLLGHAANGVTQRYAHMPDTALLGAADRVSLAIAAAIDGQEVTPANDAAPQDAAA